MQAIGQPANPWDKHNAGRTREINPYFLCDAGQNKVNWPALPFREFVTII